MKQLKRLYKSKHFLGYCIKTWNILLINLATIKNTNSKLMARRFNLTSTSKVRFVEVQKAQTRTIVLNFKAH